jgi:alpha-L-rhamnosidase
LKKNTLKSGAARLSILDTGAVGDGKTLCTRAIQRAVDKLARSGGGTVIVPRGEFLTGAINLKPGVNLHLDRGAILQGSTNIKHYPRVPTRIEGHTEPWCPAIVNASGIDGLLITGHGMIRGGGKFFWDKFWNSYNADNSTKNLDVYRPRNIFIEDCHDVLVSGIRLRDSGFWNLHLFRCKHVIVRDVDIRAPYPSPSTDGIDVDSSQNVTITGCHISVNDDCVAIKGNKGPFAASQTDIPPVEHIRIINTTFGFGHGVLTLGSEACVVRDVVIEDCHVKHSATAPETNVVVRLKLRPDTPQHYEDIHCRNIRVEGRVELLAIKAWTQYYDLKGQPAPAQLVKNVTISNVTGAVADFGEIIGPPLSTVHDIAIQNVKVRYLDRGKKPRPALRAKNLKLKNVSINGRPLRKSDLDTSERSWLESRYTGAGLK